jgi:hypothetical protein
MAVDETVIAEDSSRESLPAPERHYIPVVCSSCATVRELLDHHRAKFAPDELARALTALTSGDPFPAFSLLASVRGPD